MGVRGRGGSAIPILGTEENGDEGGLGGERTRGSQSALRHRSIQHVICRGGPASRERAVRPIHNTLHTDLNIFIDTTVCIPL